MTIEKFNQAHDLIEEIRELREHAEHVEKLRNGQKIDHSKSGIEITVPGSDYTRKMRPEFSPMGAETFVTIYLHHLRTKVEKLEKQLEAL